MTSVGVVLALMTATIAGPPAAHSSRVTWRAPVGCPDEPWLYRRVERLLDRAMNAEDGVAASATVRRVDERFAVTVIIEMGGSSSVRTLDDPDCTVLAEAVALLVAVSIDPRAAERGKDTGAGDAAVQAQTQTQEATEIPAPLQAQAQAPTEIPAPLQSQAQAPEAARKRTPATTEASRAGSRSEARAPFGDCSLGSGRAPRCLALTPRVGLQYGAVPGFAPGFGGDLALVWKRFVIESGGTFFPKRPSRRAGMPNLGANVRLGLGRVGGCGRLVRRRWEGRLCSGFEVGGLHGQGVGVDRIQRDRVLWAAWNLGVPVLWSPVPRFGFVLRPELGVPLRPYAFGVDGLGPVYRVAPALARVDLGIEVRLGTLRAGP